MSLLLNIFGYIGLALLLLAAGFLMLDILWDRQNKEQLKENILAFWIRTSELEVLDGLHRALNARYARMRSLRKRFLQLFWLFCAIIVGSSAIETIWLVKTDLRETYKTAIHNDFEWRYKIQCSHRLSERLSESEKRKAIEDLEKGILQDLDKGEAVQDETDKACDPTNRANAPPGLEYLAEREAAFQKLILASDTRSLTLSSIASQFIVIAIVALPLTIALWLSLNLTLWILSKITASRLSFVFLVLLDFIVAIIMPPLLTNTFMLLLIGAGVLTFGQILDYGSFESANWITLTLGTSFLTINFAFIWPAFLFLLAVIVPGEVGIIIAFVTLEIAAFWLAFNRAFEFVGDVGKVLRFDFSADLVSSAIDFAIFTDVLFSIFFLGPCLLLVLANRSERTRNSFLNLVMWIGDHSKGPFVAISELLTIFSRFLKK